MLLRFPLFLGALLILGTSATAVAATNDPRFAKQWGLVKIQAEQAWTQSRGGGVTIAVSDTGVDVDHPDLAAKIVAGHDYVDGGPPDDGHYHGTHVAGIAAAVTGNGTGVAGVAPDAKIMPIRVFDSEGEYHSGGPESIRLAADRGARVINLSWGPTLTLLGVFDDPEVDAAVRYAFNKGSVVVVASGNDGNPFSDPATAGVSLVVGATTNSDQKAAYSTSGPGVNIYAPGGDVTDIVFCEDDRNIWSTIRPGAGADCGGDGYDTLSGTSMAAPHVSGVAALMIAKNPSITARQVIDTMLATADMVGGLKRVNAAKAVAQAGSPIVAGGNAPGSPGGSAGSRARSRTSGGGTTSAGPSAAPSPPPPAASNASPSPTTGVLSKGRPTRPDDAASGWLKGFSAGLLVATTALAGLWLLTRKVRTPV